MLINTLSFKNIDNKLYTRKEEDKIPKLLADQRETIQTMNGVVMWLIGCCLLVWCDKLVTQKFFFVLFL